MYWLVYWFMFPACIVIAATATFSGISGAALMTPFFLIGFPLMGVPRLSTVAAIGAALFLETSGFGTGVFSYTRQGLADLRTARTLLVVTLPLAIVGSVLAHHAPATVLRLGYGVAMLGVAWLLFREGGTPGKRASVPCPCLVCESECASEDCPPGQQRELRTHDGKIYRWCPYHLAAQRIFSGVGALLTGLISTGVGEATLPTLVRRSQFPVPVAAATSTLVVAGTVLGAALTHLVQLAREGGLNAIPWSLICWGVPGAIIGATIGTRLHGRVSERSTRLFFSSLFFAIGVTFLLAFTVFARRFA
jgi:uncharacterized membrane protein YfcA